MAKHLNIHVYGRVQGVFYRASAMEIANKLDIKGFAGMKMMEAFIWKPKERKLR